MSRPMILPLVNFILLGLFRGTNFFHSNCNKSIPLRMFLTSYGVSLRRLHMLLESSQFASYYGKTLGSFHHSNGMSGDVYVADQRTFLILNFKSPGPGCGSNDILLVSIPSTSRKCHLWLLCFRSNFHGRS